MSTPSPTSSAMNSAQAAAAALATMLSLPPPPGQVVSLVDPPSQQSAIISVCTVTLIFTVIFVSSRLYSNFLVTHSQGVEDYMCVIATVLSFAYISFILDLSWVSRHMWDVPVLWFSDVYWKKRYAQNNIVAFAFFTSRLPILLLYLRVFGRKKSFRYAVYFGFFADFIVYLCNVPLLAIFCAPPPGQSWAAVFQKCQRLRPLAVAQGICNIALDIYILLLPVQTVWALNLPAKKKVGVIAIFTTGVFALIASCVSFYYRYQLTYGPDVNWNEGAFVASAAVEINVAIICSSMPACYSLLKNLSENSRLFASITSAFRLRSESSSSGNSNPKKSFFKYNSSSKPTHVHGTTQATDSRAHLPGNDYIELREETKTFNTVSVGSVSEEREPSKSLEGGRTRETVDVDMV
ncbi:MAG: hypothetical protein MMC33_009195 [Icmadophila ericetorum]|nr:hypothetical protein [Icmadophila ericetorum]